MEIWKPIPGIDHYEASSLGQIRSVDRSVPYIAAGKARSMKVLRGRILKPSLNPKTGYHLVHLGRGRAMTVHSLVALAFIGPRPADAVVRHIDGTRTNNVPENLIYGTSAQNTEDSRYHGTMQRGITHPGAKLTEKLVRDILDRLRGGESAYEIAKTAPVSYTTILKIKKGEAWRHVCES